MARTFLVTGAMLALAACGGNASQGDAPEPKAESKVVEPVAVATAEPTQPPAQARSEKEANDLYEFEYSYPAQAAVYPELKAVLDKRLADAHSELKKDTADAKKDADANGYPYRPYANSISWAVVTDTPRFVSLSSEIYIYSGGAHGISAFDTLLLDKQSKRIEDPKNVFTSPEALSAAIRQPFCAALDKERMKRRGGSVDPIGDGMFSECIDPVASTIILGSSNGQLFDRVGVLVGPYEAGPYVEGTYEVTLPVTAAVMKVVKPVYRNAFAIGN